MSDKVFWSILGVIVVGWVALYFVLVAPAKSAAMEKEEEAAQSERGLKKYAQMEPEELPTEALKSHLEAEFANAQDAYSDALSVLDERDAGFEKIMGNARNLGDWGARYDDAFKSLAARYRTHASLTEEEKLPFRQIPRDDKDPLELHQKKWRLQEMILGKAIDYGGRIHQFGFEKSRSSGRSSRNRARESSQEETFANRINVKVEIELPPKNLSQYVHDLLAHPEINFEVAAMQVGKLKSQLVRDLIGLEDKDGQPCSDRGKPLPEDVQPVVTAEPRVGVWLSLDALDWVYEEKEDG